MNAGDDILAEIERIVAADSHAAASLVLYALLMTLSSPKGQYLFLLNKLRDLAPGHRDLAYGLMEKMASGEHLDAEWQAAVSRIEALIRGNQPRR